jgi:hypothetical protein
MTVASPVSGWRLRPGGRVQAPPPESRHRSRAAGHAERPGAAPSLRAVGTACDELGQARFEDLGPRAVASDSDRFQELLRLVTLDPPLSYAEVGELLGMPHGSIGPTRARCLEQLRGTTALRPYVTGR